jgi:hypothetical protein
MLDKTISIECCRPKISQWKRTSPSKTDSADINAIVHLPAAKTGPHTTTKEEGPTPRSFYSTIHLISSTTSKDFAYPFASINYSLCQKGQAHTPRVSNHEFSNAESPAPLNQPCTLCRSREGLSFYLGHTLQRRHFPAAPTGLALGYSVFILVL